MSDIVYYNTEYFYNDDIKRSCLAFILINPIFLLITNYSHRTEEIPNT